MIVSIYYEGVFSYGAVKGTHPPRGQGAAGVISSRSTVFEPPGRHKLLGAIADEFAKYFDTSKATVVLTAEASDPLPATVCARRYGVYMLFAKKAKSDNIESGLIQSEIFPIRIRKR